MGGVVWFRGIVGEMCLIIRVFLTGPALQEHPQKQIYVGTVNYSELKAN